MVLVKLPYYVITTIGQLPLAVRSLMAGAREMRTTSNSALNANLAVQMFPVHWADFVV